jgi:hypothetical protein
MDACPAIFALKTAYAGIIKRAEKLLNLRLSSITSR